MIYTPPKKVNNEIYLLISKIKNIKKRNLLRGYCQRGYLSSSEIEALRANNSYSDNKTIGAIIKGPGGLKEKANRGITKCSDLFKIKKGNCADYKSEISYLSGYLNSRISECCSIIEIIKELAYIERIDTSTALDMLLDISKNYGASNYLSFKLAYIKSSRELSPEMMRKVSNIEENTGHNDAPGFYYSALEALGSRISLFLIARRRVNGLVAKIDNDFRSAPSLQSLVSTPIDDDDLAHFLFRATENTLTDTLYACLILINLSDRYPEASKFLQQALSPRLAEKINNLVSELSAPPTGEIVSDFYHAQNIDSDPSLDLYRISTAFLERKFYAQYRNMIDRVIGARLVYDITSFIPNDANDLFENRNVILAVDEIQDTESNDFAGSMDTFYRTFLFLRHILNRNNLVYLKTDEFRFILENTMGLDSLLLDDEIQALNLTVPDDSKGLVAVLALALYRKKTSDPDVDYDFREDFISYVQKDFEGSILQFINSLLEDSPSIANYIVASLDEHTIEKMYDIVTSAKMAAEIRRDILRAVGTKLNRIEYFVEADTIVTRFKVSKLQKYFDASRMYVDSIAMKKWLDSNPSVYTEQYRNLHPKVIAKISNDGLGGQTILLEIESVDQLLVAEIFRDSFEVFCLNNEFGIQSYLGRRIRHNTLDGVMLKPVDAIFQKEVYRPLALNPSFRATFSAWLSAYKSLIEKLKRDYLQFDSNSSLFNAKIDIEDHLTKENIWQLRRTLRVAGGAELLNELIISSCWKQISPQLEKAARFIRVDLLKEAYESTNSHFPKYGVALEINFKQELQDALNSVFRKVASWFQIPQTGFVAASVRDLSQIILLDLVKPETPVQWSGDALDKKYTGIGVHRIYDCLAVILQNAFLHSQDESNIKIDMESRKLDGSILDDISVRITSTASSLQYEACKKRIESAIAADESGKDMVSEGYSGIKKIKFITRLNEGQHTIKFSHSDEERSLTIGFSLRVENSLEEPTSEQGEI